VHWLLRADTKGSDARAQSAVRSRSGYRRSETLVGFWCKVYGLDALADANQDISKSIQPINFAPKPNNLKEQVANTGSSGTVDTETVGHNKMQSGADRYWSVLIT